MRIPLTNHPVVIAVALLLVALLGWGFWPQPVVIETIEAERAPLTITVEEEGRTRVIDRYIISAPVDGVACRVQLDVGDPVQQGEVLLGITPLESQVLDQRSRAQAIAMIAAAQSNLAAAREQASAAESAAQLATNELKRLQPLARKGLASKGELDRVETEVQTSTAAKRSADFSVQVASYEVQAAQSVLEYSAGAKDEPVVRVPITSPVTGKILKVLRECEGPVHTGEPLLEVGDPAALEVEVDVLSADAVQIKPGMRVLFERWGGDQPLQGVVRIVEPVGFTKFSALGVEEQRVLIISDLTSPSQEWQRLGDGYRYVGGVVAIEPTHGRGKRSTAGADDEPGAIVPVRLFSLGQSISEGGQTGLGESLLGRVDTEHVGARDRLVELAIADEVTGAEQHLRRDLDGPLRWVELGERPHRRLAIGEPLPNFRDGTARTTDDAASRENDRVGGFTHAWTSSGFRKTRELFDPPKPSELERAARIFIFTGSPTTRFTSQSGSGVP